jgi:TPR repeat protein
MKKVLQIVMALLLLDLAAARAGPFEDADSAHRRGDFVTELQIYQPLAAEGNARGQYHLGLMYYNGSGVGQDYAEAGKWFRLAAEQGSAPAQAYLAPMYLKGVGVRQDHAEAAKWYRALASQGVADGQTGIGWMLCNVEGAPHDCEEAAKWLRLAAAQGHGFAQINLGIMHVTGRGVAQDYVRADMWINLAVETKYADTATKARNMIETQMTLEQIEAAHRLARECRQKNFQDCD